MKWLQRVIQAWQKARELPYLGRGSFAVAIGLLILSIMLGWHRTHPDDDVGAAIQQAQLAEISVPKSILVLANVLPYLNLWVTLGLPVLLLVIWRRWGDLKRLMFPVSVAAVSVALWAIASDLVEYIAHSQMTEMGEPPAPVAFAFKLVFIALVLISVPLVLLLSTHRPLGALHPTEFPASARLLLRVILLLMGHHGPAGQFEGLPDFQIQRARCRWLLPQLDAACLYADNAGRIVALGALLADAHVTCQ